MNLIHPVKNFIITQNFGENPGDYVRFGRAGHNGVDYGVPIGTQVRAAADGKVSATGNDPGGYGVFVTVAHDDGSLTHYAHLSEIKCRSGMRVLAGDVIALSGSTGNSTGPHLHFEYRTPADKLEGYPAGERDPLKFIAAEPAPAPTPAIPYNGSTIWQGSGTVQVATLNIRTGPGTEYKIVGELHFGAEVPFNGLVMKEVWAKLQDGNYVALVHNGTELANIKTG